MSGTSLDGVDLVAVRFNNALPQILASKSYPMPSDIKQLILELCSESSNEIEKLGHLDIALGQLFANACNCFIDEHKNIFARSSIRAIGLHGQTIRHRPNNYPKHNFTLQIGDANCVSEITGITTVADFRRRDVAAGGQGAPLVPAFHQGIFYSPDTHRVIINIGGMANITLLNQKQDANLIGFDTGPGNVLMDAWINHQRGLAYDENGDWAATGNVNSQLLSILLSLNYFSQPIPKSTGREQFNLQWIEQCLLNIDSNITPEDVQATLLELTAQSIANEIKRQSQDDLTNITSAFDQAEIYVCGGGAHNKLLMKRLKKLLPKASCVSDTLGLQLDPDCVEATAFAWLAKQTLAGLDSNCPTVTGAKGKRILGAIYQA
jgi:anhydro-N-acetylmuramic acid kinase